MPHYSVMMLGVQGAAAMRAFAQKLGLALSYDPDDDAFDLTEGAALSDLNRTLEAIHLAVLADPTLGIPDLAYLGTEIVKTPYSTRTEHRLRTPWGQRRFSPISMGVSYDPHEVGDEPENAVLGVWLSARYQPSLLDMHDEHGSLEGEREEFSWASDAVAWQKRAASLVQAKLIDAVPAFRDARLIQKGEFA